jgi:ABC-type phosphate transport system auxiliary subunit
MGFFSDTMDEIAKLQAELEQERSELSSLRARLEESTRYLKDIKGALNNGFEIQPNSAFHRGIESFLAEVENG